MCRMVWSLMESLDIKTQWTHPNNSWSQHTTTTTKSTKNKIPIVKSKDNKCRKNEGKEKQRKNKVNNNNNNSIAKPKPLYDEDIVDGFAILSFKSFKDLEIAINGKSSQKKKAKSKTQTTKDETSISSTVSSQSSASQLSSLPKYSDNKNNTNKVSNKLTANKLSKTTTKCLKKVESNNAKHIKHTKCDKKLKQNACHMNNGINKSVNISNKNVDNKDKHKTSNCSKNNKSSESVSIISTTHKKTSINVYKPQVLHINQITINGKSSQTKKLKSKKASKDETSISSTVSSLSSASQLSQLKYSDNSKSNANKVSKLTANKISKATAKCLKKVESNSKHSKCDKKLKQNACHMNNGINKSVNISNKNVDNKNNKHKSSNSSKTKKSSQSVSIISTTHKNTSINVYKPQVLHINQADSSDDDSGDDMCDDEDVKELIDKKLSDNNNNNKRQEVSGKNNNISLNTSTESNDCNNDSTVKKCLSLSPISSTDTSLCLSTNSSSSATLPPNSSDNDCAVVQQLSDSHNEVTSADGVNTDSDNKSTSCSSSSPKANAFKVNRILTSSPLLSVSTTTTAHEVISKDNVNEVEVQSNKHLNSTVNKPLVTNINESDTTHPMDSIAVEAKDKTIAYTSHLIESVVGDTNTSATAEQCNVLTGDKQLQPSSPLNNKLENSNKENNNSNNNNNLDANCLKLLQNSTSFTTNCNNNLTTIKSLHSFGVKRSVSPLLSNQSTTATAAKHIRHSSPNNNNQNGIDFHNTSPLQYPSASQQSFRGLSHLSQPIGGHNLHTTGKESHNSIGSNHTNNIITTSKNTSRSTSLSSTTNCLSDNLSTKSYLWSSYGPSQGSNGNGVNGLSHLPPPPPPSGLTGPGVTPSIGLQLSVQTNSMSMFASLIASTPLPPVSSAMAPSAATSSFIDQCNVLTGDTKHSRSLSPLSHKHDNYNKKNINNNLDANCLKLLQNSTSNYSTNCNNNSSKSLHSFGVKRSLSPSVVSNQSTATKHSRHSSPNKQNCIDLHNSLQYPSASHQSLRSLSHLSQSIGGHNINTSKERHESHRVGSNSSDSTNTSKSTSRSTPSLSSSTSCSDNLSTPKSFLWSPFGSSQASNGVGGVSHLSPSGLTGRSVTPSIGLQSSVPTNSLSMYASPIASASATLTPVSSAMAPPSAASSSPFIDQDFLRRELDNRFLASQNRTINMPPPPYMRPEVHHHMHLPQNQPFPISPLTSSLGSQTNPFDKFTKMDQTYYGRNPLGLSTFTSLSPLLTPGSASTSKPIGLSGSSNTPFGPPGHLAAFQPKLNSYKNKTNKPLVKSGRWCAMHVRIAWEIYHHQQHQQQKQLDVTHKNNMSLVSTNSGSKSGSASNGLLRPLNTTFSLTSRTQDMSPFSSSLLSGGTPNRSPFDSPIHQYPSTPAPTHLTSRTTNFTRFPSFGSLSSTLSSLSSVAAGGVTPSGALFGPTPIATTRDPLQIPGCLPGLSASGSDLWSRSSSTRSSAAAVAAAASLFGPMSPLTPNSAVRSLYSDSL
ncbi:putative uncharacterized protein DDB_G0277255 [Oppia nitens]|uniref:putative uncharacterized protein DDB_G0277255 n=1 Tax=Oppia nitens TaxID=1686743 RepID=UPI0023DAC696|nr:putative uncharacterized protein DDB_G0277255 [Oppia nitens]